MSVSYPQTGGTISQSGLSPSYLHKHVATDTTNNIARWELYDGSSPVDNSHGFSIRWNSTTSKNEINVNDASSPYFNDGDPLTLSLNHGSLLQTTNTSQWHEIVDGDVVQFFSTSSGTSWGDSWTVSTAAHLWTTTSSGGGSSGGNSGPPPQQPSGPNKKVFHNFW